MKTFERAVAREDVGSKEKKGRILSPEELRVQMTLVGQEEERLARQIGIAPATLPSGTMVNNIDVGGKTIKEVLAGMQGVDLYEPPVVVQTEVTPTTTELPAWLSNYPDLVWHGAHDNPLWEPTVRQYKDHVTVTFVRREEHLTPGKGEESQQRKLEPIQNKFTLEEWRVVRVVLDDYLEAEKDAHGSNPQKRFAAKQKILAALRFENAYRHGKQGKEGVASEDVIGQAVQRAREHVAKTVRGFNGEGIDVAKLSRDTAELLSQLVVLNRTRGDGKEYLVSEKKMSEIREYPSFEYTMENLAESLEKQSRQEQGISYMIGEPGTGKNIAAEYFAYKTNRPFFWFPCGRGMESMDLMFHYDFDSEEGTKRFLTDLARGIQTPGAIVLIDEVNALKPQVQALLHGLGDKNRSLAYDAVKIPAAQGVLIIMASNPATQGSAGNLSEALLNRTRGMAFTVEYPAMTKGDLAAMRGRWDKDKLNTEEQTNNALREYACDEALLLYELLPEFNHVPTEVFKKLWDAVVNEHRDLMGFLEKDATLADLLGKNKQKTVATLRDIKDMLEIADAWRKYFGEKKMGFDIVGFSVRDSLAVMREYADVRDVKKAFLRVYDDFKKNPIDGLDAQYIALKKLLDQKLGIN